MAWHSAGEIVEISRSGVQVLHTVSRPCHRGRAAFCIFEYVYFAKPSSHLEGACVVVPSCVIGRYVSSCVMCRHVLLSLSCVMCGQALPRTALPLQADSFSLYHLPPIRIISSTLARHVE